jgi:hypothetical protein
VGALKAMAPAMDARATTTLSIVCSCTNRVRNQILVRKTTNTNDKCCLGKNSSGSLHCRFSNAKILDGPFSASTSARGLSPIHS